MAARDWIWRRDRASPRFLLRVRQNVGLQVRGLRKFLVATLKNINVRIFLKIWCLLEPQRGRRRGGLPCVCARVSSGWSRGRISFHSPQKCTGTVFPRCEPVGVVSVCCFPQKLFHIPRKHVPWQEKRVNKTTLMVISFFTWARVCEGVFSLRCCLETSEQPLHWLLLHIYHLYCWYWQ